MRNNLAGDVNNEVEYEIRGEHIANGVRIKRLAGVLAIPGTILTRTPNGFHWIYAGASQDGSSVQLYAQNPYTPPPRDVFRVMGAWGTKPGSGHLAAQVQVDRVVQFEPDYTYDTSLDASGGSYLPTWTKRYAAAMGHFPVGLCAAVYLRPEARRMTDLKTVNIVGGGTLGLGMGQVNIGGVNVTEGVEGTASNHYITQVKSLTRYDQPEASEDMMRCMIDPRSDWYAVRSNNYSNITVLASGYELMPT